MTATEPTTAAPANPLAGFLAAMKEKPGDATTLLVLADFIEDGGGPVEFGLRREAVEYVRKTAARLPKSWGEWEAFAKRLEELNDAMDAFGNAVIPVKTTNRALGPKERAELARELFKELGLKGVRVEMQTGSMMFGVDATIPARIDAEYRRWLIPGFDWATDPQNGANWTAETIVRRILIAAFPAHIDRSRPMEDYYDDPWTIRQKVGADYDPPKPRKPAKPKSPNLDGLDAKIDAFVEAWHENGRPFWEYENTPGMKYDEYCRKEVKERNKYVALDQKGSGVFLVDKATGIVWSIKGYGVPNRMIGFIDDLTAKYKEATAKNLMKR